MSTTKNSSDSSFVHEVVLDFTEWAHYLYSQKLTILTTMLLVFAMTYVYTKTLVPRYEADSLLQVEPKQAQMPGIEDVTVLLDRGARNLRGAVSREEAIIKSRTVLGEVVDVRKLQVEAVLDYFPYFGEAMAARYSGKSLAPNQFGLSEYAWGGERIKIDRINVPAKENKVSSWRVLVQDDKKYTLFDRTGNKVLEGKEGEAATGTYKGNTVGMYVSELFARPGLGFSVNVYPRLKAISRLASRVELLERGERTGILSVHLVGKNAEKTKETLNAVVEAYVGYNLKQHSNRADNMLKFIKQHLPKVKEQEDKAELALQEFRVKEGVVDLSITTQQSMAALAEIDKSISEMDLQKAELLESYTKKHPSISMIDSKRKILEKERAKLSKGFENLSEKELMFVKLQRKVVVSTKIHLSMISRQNGLLLAKEGATGNVNIIDSAEKPYVPLTQHKSLILLAGLFTGLILGIFGVALSRVLHRGIVDTVVLEAKTGLHVLASIMFSKTGSKLCANRKGEETGLIAMVDPADIAVEGLRGLRTGVHFALENTDGNLIVISGPTPGVGKSFVSSNFAATYASSGRKVLLIDGDIRRGGLHHCIGRHESSPGLTDFISGRATFDDVCQEITDNFHFISKGSIEEYPAEALSSKVFSDFVEQCKVDYEIVIIDTPPILLVTDASVVAQHSAQLLLVVKAGISQIGEVEQSISQFKKTGVEVSGLVMNFVGKGSGYYGYGGRYHYGSKYKYSDY